MSRPTLKAAVEWIAVNDNSGEDGPGDPNAERRVSEYVTTALVADLFDVSATTIARRVMALRRLEADAKVHA